MDFSTCVANENICLWNKFAIEFDFINKMVFPIFDWISFNLEIVKQKWNNKNNQDIGLIQLGLRGLGYIGHAPIMCPEIGS